MRILQVCPYDWHSPGGVQTHVRGLAEALRSRGHDVLIAAPGGDAAVEPDVRIVGRPVRLSFNGTTAPVCFHPAAMWRVRQLLRSFEPDVVHLHEPLAPSIAGVAGMLTSALVVATFHAHCDARIGPWLYRLGTWPLNRWVSAGMAVSPAATTCLSARVRVPFRIVPNGVEPDLFALDIDRPRARPARLLFAHRMEARKGLDVMLAAFTRLVSAQIDAELVLVGDGPERRRVDAVPADVRRRIRVCGAIAREALRAEFGAATVFVAPALNGESFGVVLVEAMAAGVPIVASDITGYREVLRGSGGLLVPPGDAEALAGALTRILRAPDVAAEMAATGRAHARRFSWDRVADEVERVYLDAIASDSRALKRAAI